MKSITDTFAKLGFSQAVIPAEAGSRSNRQHSRIPACVGKTIGNNFHVIRVATSDRAAAGKTRERLSEH